MTRLFVRRTKFRTLIVLGSALPFLLLACVHRATASPVVTVGETTTVSNALILVIKIETPKAPGSATTAGLAAGGSR
jgi:hypothetical protein